VPVDVQEIGCDFYAISGHKVYGPTGIGVLYGRSDLLEAMPPYQGGGEMIRSVTFEKTTYAPPPAKFEAGTPHIAGAVGLGTAIDYVEELGWDFIHQQETVLLEHALERLAAVPGLRFVGSAAARASVISFVLEGIHAHDIGTIVDQRGVAIRTGHHCTQPVMDYFGVPATARASFAFYNSVAEVDILAEALLEAREVFGA
jgi:cysteine desulfurase/selenocysteine lyase